MRTYTVHGPDNEIVEYRHFDRVPSGATWKIVTDTQVEDVDGAYYADRNLLESAIVEIVRYEFEQWGWAVTHLTVQLHF